MLRLSMSIFIVLSAAAGDVLAATEPPKFGVVDMQAVILNVKEGKEAREILEKEIKEKEKEFAKKKVELDKMNEDWKKQSAVLSEDARFKKQNEFQEKFVAMRNAEMEFSGQVKRKEQQATQKIAVKAAEIVEKIAKEKKLDVVFESNSSGIVYINSPVNVTEDTIKGYEAAPKDLAKKEEPKK